MKTTIDIPDNLYRQLKAKSALKGRPVREVAIDLFQHWVEKPEKAGDFDEKPEPEAKNKPLPRWFGALRKYAAQARGRHDMNAIRKSIARGKAGQKH